MGAFIRAQGISVVFEARDDRRVVLDNVDVAVAEGEFYVVVGPSGCGKSTLLNVIAGLVRPVSGRMEIAGHEIREPYTQAGIAFQHHNLLEWRTVRENVLLPLEIKRINNAAYIFRAQQLLEATGLAGFENHYPHELSGGMRQRAAMCRALVADLPLLLMDEPFGALDALTREEHQIMLQDLWMRERKTVVFITHDVREAILLGDRVAVMSSRPGRIVETVDVEFPRPRSQQLTETPEFNALVHRVRTKLFERPA